MIYHWNFLFTFGQQKIKSTHLSDIAWRSFYSAASFCRCRCILLILHLVDKLFGECWK